MKKITKILSIFLMGSLLVACSDIADDERLIYVEPATVNRAVLIEDFTGQRCVNCPNATIAIHEIQQAYGEENVIPVAIHCGPFGFAGNAKTLGLKTDLGQTYWDAWFENTQGQPVAKFNRGAANDKYANWSASVAQELAKPTDVSIDIDVAHDAETRKLTISSRLVAPAGEKAKYQLWLLEDGIVAIQSQPDGSVKKDYVHNHVLREAINGTWGEDVTFAETPLKLNKEFTYSDKYDATKLSIVAFVYDKNGVRQVVKKTLKH